MAGKFQSVRNHDKYLRFASDSSATLVGEGDASIFELEGTALKFSNQFVAIEQRNERIVFKLSSKPCLMWNEADSELGVVGHEGCLDIYDKNANHVQFWKRNGHRNQKWKWVQGCVDLGIPALVLRDINGISIPFRITGGGGNFRHPVFFSEAAQLTKKQRRPQPILVMSETDWDFLKNPKVTHEGAFGRDYELWTESTVEQRRVQGEGITEHRWVIVWKFPGDLNRIEGYHAIYDVPLPVGAYPLLDDKWFVPNKRPSHPDIPIDHVAVEKLRIDKAQGGNLHVLESVENGVQVAMIGSHYFIKALWGETKEERQNVSAMLMALYKAGVYAFPCYGQHHAIVFYWDLKHGSLITPKALSKLLQDDQVFNALLSYTRNQRGLCAWRESYSAQAWCM